VLTPKNKRRNTRKKLDFDKKRQNVEISFFFVHFSKMGKRPRTPHFITGIGDGNVHDKAGGGGGGGGGGTTTDDVFQLRGNRNNGGDAKNGEPGSRDSHKSNYNYYYNLRAAKNERLQRLEEPLLASGDGGGGPASSADHWRDVFGNPVLDTTTGRTIGKPPPPTIATGPWQVSAFAFLGMIVVISAIFLHFVSDGSHHYAHGENTTTSTPYHYRRRQRQRRRQQFRKKKTDEWSDDEEPVQNGAGLVPDALLPGMIHNAMGGATLAAAAGGGGQWSDHDSNQDHYYQQQPSYPRFSAQDSRLRRTAKEHSSPARTSGSRLRTSSNGSNYYAMPGSAAQVGGGPGVVPTYKSPAPNNLMSSSVTAPRMPQRGISPKNSFNSHGSHGQSHYQQQQHNSSFAESPIHARSTAPISGRNRVPSTPDAKDIFRSVDAGCSSHHSSKGTTTILPPPPEESPLLMPKPTQAGDTATGSILHVRHLNSNISFPSIGADDNVTSGDERMRKYSTASQSSQRPMGLREMADAASVHSSHSQNIQQGFSSHHQQSLLLSPGDYEETPRVGNARRLIADAGSFDEAALMPPNNISDNEYGDPPIPFIPALALFPDGASPRLHAEPPPRSILMDELRLVQMETGNSDIHWGISEPEAHQQSFALDDESDESSEGSDISIPSNDPRKSIHHKRSKLTEATDSASSLQSGINFDELQLVEVIGGGGFGQVWKATWRGTPVAVKILTGSAQNTHIAKAILEEFKAEINLLKGMRHPNICLYMGACVDPPNRAIITELASNGSVWDALRLPLSPPFVVADGTAQGAWPLHLYMPDHHGAPPSSQGAPRISAPIPPRGSWPWELVKKVSCGAARGMAYLHSGNPPVLHRDLKSANLLLDDSYTTKVCDFGLSRLKAQTRSMTGNCGTVQWMAPEVLANRSYDEKADVYSFGIIVWELLARECPYEGMTAIQCALAVLNRDKRPEIPKWCPPGLHALIKACVKKEPSERPSFAEVIPMIDEMG
jgi:serine/threonine protein kinase